jgi:hypothetical protein
MLHHRPSSEWLELFRDLPAEARTGPCRGDDDGDGHWGELKIENRKLKNWIDWPRALIVSISHFQFSISAPPQRRRITPP